MHSACSVLAFLLCLACAPVSAQGMRMLAQRSPLAGGQFHELSAVWPQLREGDALTLEREPDNPHDQRAIRILWRGHMLGYLPRASNFEAASEMDAGQRLSARIGKLNEHPDPWQRMRIEVYVDLLGPR